MPVALTGHGGRRRRRRDGRRERGLHGFQFFQEHALSAPYMYGITYAHHGSHKKVNYRHVQYG
eukprot:1915009-Prymnesium_polylepis.1